jgi:uncharacterized membrane protein YhiD involved in acid resistance
LAIFSSVLMFIALRVLGAMEQRFSLKSSVMNYFVTSEKPAPELVAELHSMMDQRGKEVRGLHLTRREGRQCLAFSAELTRREQKELMEAMRHSEALKNFEVKTGMDVD